jgi:YegS/Rv2252/BmrU family lipid kinase
MSPTIQYLPNSAERILIVTNPHAGFRPRVTLIDQLVTALEADGFVVEVVTELAELPAKSETSHAGPVRAVIAAGGDGTVSEVVNRTAPNTPVAVLPLGTENLLAKYLGIRQDVDQIRHLIGRGASVQLDAGRAGQRIFLLMAGCGFDAEVVRRLHQERSGNIHHLSYAKPIIDSIRSYEYPELRVFCEPPAGAADTSQAQGDQPYFTARWVFVVNLPRYAAGLQIVPDAVGADGLLDVCTFKGGSLFSGLRYLAGILLGQHRSWDDCITHQTRKLRIESDGDVPLQLDGDPAGCLPVEIESLPRRVRLIVSEVWARRHGFAKPAPA